MRRLTIAIVLIALALFGAGCGGGDESSADTDTIAVTDTTATEETTDETTTDETTTSETETDVSGAFGSEECRELIEASVALSQAFVAASNAGESEEATAFFEEFVDKAPEEIRADLRVLADAYAEYIAALGDIQLEAGQTPTPEQAQRLQQALASIDQQAVNQASERVSAWANQNCPSG